ncbi:MAG: sigma 54-interacting transcriptional regulator [Candidatus Riflebacteria bacterium]|nr:sigma 54-interacting transcriptional regulator [Candidatus Riflebacteria bacterium]
MRDKAGERSSGSSTIRLRRGRATSPTIESCTLRVIDGPDADLCVTLEGRPIKLGTGVECDVRLADGSVSRSHAVISYTPDGFSIEDLGSTNGTLVDGVSVRSALVHPGCRIRLGNTVLLFSSSPRKLFDGPSVESSIGGLLGRSEEMRRVFSLIEQVAPTEATVVICGETGTGKEVAARAIHDLSPRKDAPFLVFDCANVNRDLLGSELFGHGKGAFTGAIGAHRGAFERAHRGTVLLDEIGELPLDIQVRLLGLLQRREVLPLGAEAAIPVDVRVLAATHRHLEAMMEQGTFREDLYFRLAVITIELPPLRERPEDIPLLARRFLHELSGAGRRPATLTQATLDHLATLPWKGNVRELRNWIQRAVVLSCGSEIEPRHFEPPRRTVPSESPRAPEGPPARPSGRAPSRVTLEDVERCTIRDAYARNERNKARAARELGISLSTFKRRFKEFGLRKEFGEAEDEPLS